MKDVLTVFLLEPYYGGSHRQWVNGFKKNSRHDIELLTLPARNWKWRMHGAAVSFASSIKKLPHIPDVILATDMLDVATFRGLNPEMAHIPIALYFHENQITYPWSKSDEDVILNRDNHYGFVNYTSALAADRVLFNSHYHMNSFLDELPWFLAKFPDGQDVSTVQAIKSKSEVLHLGMELSELEKARPETANSRNRATILWNHRWEYDKNPEEFFQALYEVQSRGWEFCLIVVGESFSKYPRIFDEAKVRLKDRIIHWGYVESREEYTRLLWQSDILPVTSNQDFFGGSIVEAMHCNVKPLLPDRLAYSEHVPSNLHHVFFYEEGELVDRLQRWIKDVSVLRKQQTRSFVEKYDWSILSSDYDNVLVDVVNSR